MNAATSMLAWAPEALPRLDGHRAIVTGGASGIGLATVRGLVALGADVLIADIDVERAQTVCEELRDTVPGARISARRLDLSAPDDIARFVEAWRGTPLHILVNNAGILPPLQRRTTAEGFELAFAISVLGHFALTAHLLPALRASTPSRVVWVSSLVHRRAQLRFDDLHGEGRYAPQGTYNQAKLASLMLALEMDRQARSVDSRVSSLAAHPGVARTRIGDSRRGQTRRGLHDHLTDLAFAWVMRLLGQPPDVAARSIVMAAADPLIGGGSFIGPQRRGETGGAPGVLEPAAAAMDVSQRVRLWRAVEAMTGQHFAWH